MLGSFVPYTFSTRYGNMLRVEDGPRPGYCWIMSLWQHAKKPTRMNLFLHEC